MSSAFSVVKPEYQKDCDNFLSAVFEKRDKPTSINQTQGVIPCCTAVNDCTASDYHRCTHKQRYCCKFKLWCFWSAECGFKSTNGDTCVPIQDPCFGGDESRWSHLLWMHVKEPSALTEKRRGLLCPGVPRCGCWMRCSTLWNPSKVLHTWVSEFIPSLTHLSESLYILSVLSTMYQGLDSSV